MDEPSLDLEKPNAVGALDRITTNVALSLIAVVPTFLMCLVAPWRLSGLLTGDDPEGRAGMRLAPGAFFPLCLLLSMIIGAQLTTPELARNNGAFLGPNLALSIQSAIAEGDVWRTVSTVMPIYAFAVLTGTLGVALKFWAHKEWTLRVSIRAAFYIFGVLVSWIILSTAVIDIVRTSTGGAEIVDTLMMLVPIPVLWIVFWMYFWFFRNEGDLTYLRSGILSVAMIALMFIALVSMGLFLSL